MALGALLGGASPAHAQRAALVQIADDEAHSPYLDGNERSCTFAGACAVSLSKVPTGHRRIVEYISCYATVAGGGQLQSLTLVSDSYALPRIFLPIVRQGTGFYVTYVANLATSMKFEAGETPLGYAFSDNIVTDLFCTLSGRDILVP